MSVVKVSATVLVLALVLHTGCDFWCHDSDEATSATQLQGASVPPCHQPSDGKQPDHQQQPNHETSSDCIHPQAADDSSKLQTKIAKANLPVTPVQVFGIENRRQIHDSLRAIRMIGVSPSDSTASILRI